MNKKQKQIRLQHLKDLKKFRSLFNNSHFVKKNIQDMIALLSSVTDSIQELRKAVININAEIRDLKFDKMDKSSQNFRNDNFNDRLINLEENKIKVIDEELKRIDTLEQAFNREF